jgi:hypothetical protein
MNVKLAIFMVVALVFMITTIGTITSFISAVAPEVTKYNCDAAGKLCAVWFADGSTMLCKYNDSTKKWDCEFITSPPKTGSNIPTDLKGAIDDAFNDVGPSNSNDPKDLGGMKSDKPTTMSPNK